MTAVAREADAAHVRVRVVPRRNDIIRFAGYVYPVELAAVFVLSSYVGAGVSPLAAIRALVVSMLLAIAIVAILGLALRDADWTGVAFLLLLPLNGAFSRPAYLLLVLAAALLIVLLTRRLGRPRWLGGFSRTVTTFVTVLVAVVIGTGIAGGTITVSDFGQGAGLDTVRRARAHDPGDGTKPDIYVFILDGYARADHLRDEFGFDNAPFLGALRSRGFDVAANSHSNYPVTAQTLVSMLNMAYIDQIGAVATIKRGNPAGDGSYRYAINHGRVFDLLHAQGYTVIATGSGWEQLALRQADVYIDHGELNTFESGLLNRFGGSVVERLLPQLAGDQARDRLDAAFADVRTIAAIPAGPPRLVVLHLLAPHAPYAFGPDGEKLAVSLHDFDNYEWIGAARRSGDIDAYTGQIRWVNAQTLRTVDAIGAGTRRAAVVVMSDHGSRMLTEAGQRMQTPEAIDNLFASYTPNHAGLFGDNPTPVNVFSHLLNAYFGESIPVQPNRCYITDWATPFEFLPIDCAGR